MKIIQKTAICLLIIFLMAICSACKKNDPETDKAQKIKAHQDRIRKVKQLVEKQRASDTEKIADPAETRSERISDKLEGSKERAIGEKDIKERSPVIREKSLIKKRKEFPGTD